MPPQPTSFTDLHPPQMRFVPTRDHFGSHWTEVHLGEVKIGETQGLWLHPKVLRGPLTKKKLAKLRFLRGQEWEYGARAPGGPGPWVPEKMGPGPIWPVGVFWYLGLWAHIERV